MSRLRVISDPEEAERLWMDLYALQPDPSPFYEWDFSESIAELFGWKCLTVQVEEVLLAKLVVRKRSFFSDVVVPPLTQFTPILLAPSADNEARQAALKCLFEDHAALPFSRYFSFAPHLSSILEGVGSNWCHMAKDTYVLPTANTEEAIAKWSSSTRRNFRNATDKYEFTSEAVSSKHVVEMTETAYERAGMKLSLPSHVVGTFAEALVERGLGRIVGLTSKETGELEAGIVLIESKEMAWYWLAGSERGEAMTVLMAHTQEFLHQRGIAALDLVGANTPSIAEFKRRFGGALVSYTHVVRQSRSLKMAKSLNALFTGEMSP